ncbi:putative aquaporin 2 [Paratrimastix pyriformis]|uniref:Aquaporin 2 n=1 Tax=Paratrimastix pyriformis TaxID=342808 RepID=A0ABQ8UTJ5_9EUKA|nr:putative aquaporin 2 [Paratrimastix pyriformis]
MQDEESLLPITPVKNPIFFKNPASYEQHNLVVRALLETFGTCILTFAACSAPVPDMYLSSKDFLPSAIVVFVAICGLIFTIGDFTGCHINPAVTLAMFLVGATSWVTSLVYVVAQLVGGIAGAALARFLFSNHSSGETHLASDATIIGGLSFEALGTFILVMVVLRCCVQLDVRMPLTPATQTCAPFIIGLTVTMVSLLGADVTGASLNPARSLGPAVIWNDWTDQWIYWVAPPVGASVASLVFYLMRIALRFKKQK